MSKVSFGEVSAKREEAPDTPVTEVVEDKAELATAESTALAQPASDASGVVGEVDSSDIQFPRLRVIQGTSKFASKKTPVGTLTLGFEDLFVVADEGEKVPFVVASFRKQFQEKVPWGSDQMPKLYDTRAEVEANGGQVMNPRGACYYDSIAHLNLFVGLPLERLEKAADQEESDLIEALFQISHGDMLWAPAVYTASGMSYSSFAKSVLTAQRFQCPLLWQGLFKMHVSEVPTNFGPKKKLNASFDSKLTGEDLSFFANLTGNNG